MLRTLLFCGVSAIVMTTAAQAQQQPIQEQVQPRKQAPTAPTGSAATPVEQAEEGIRDIVVTAQRREQRLQTVPIAVTAIGGDSLTTRGGSSLADVSNLAPNLVFKPTAAFSGASNAATVFIRGLGQTNFEITTDPGVGTYLDGVYISRAVGGVLDSLYIQRVEVLRGPQGTLFGRNTIGGAVSVTSKRPGKEFGGEVALTTGSFSRFQAGVAVDLPVSESVQFRVSGLTKNRKGYVRRVLVGDRMGNENSDSFRVSGHADFASNFTVDAAYDYNRVREQSAANQAAFTRPQGPGDIQLAPIVIPGLGSVLPGDPRLIPGDPDISYGTGPNKTRINLWGASVELGWELPFAKLKSITAHRETKANFGRDGDATPFVTGHQDRQMNFRQFSQELQMTGDAFGDVVQYTGGLYYFNETARDRVLVTLGQVLPLPGIRIDNYVKNQALAAYAQASIKLSDRLSAVLGLRHTEEKKRYATTQIIEAINLPLVGRPDAQRTFRDTAPRLGLNFQATGDFLLYGYVAKGFKSGGFNSTYVLPVAAPIGYNPEKIWTYEGGVKWQGFGRTLRLNAAVFHSDYSDIQVTLFDAGGAPTTQNGGEANIDGFELEGDWVPARWFRLSGNAAYLHARYVKGSILPPPAGITLLGDPLRDTNRLPNAPDTSFSLSPQLLADVGSGRADIRADVTHSGAIENDAANSPELHQSAYTLVDASIGYTATGGRWNIRAGVRNITDERIIVSGGIGRGPNFGDRNWNRPREWFASLGGKF